MAATMSSMAPTKDRFNARRNILFAIGEFGTSALLLFASYRIVIADAGLEMLGLWSTLFAWTSLLRIGDFGVSGAIVRFVALINPSDRRALERHIGTAVVATSALFLLIAGAGYVLLSELLLRTLPVALMPTAVATLPLLLLSFILSGITGSLLGALTGLHHGYLRSVLVIAGTSIQLALVALLVPTFGLPGLAGAQVAQAAMIIIAAWLLVRKVAELPALLPLTFDLGTFRSMLGFSISSQVANLTNGLFEPLSKLLVGHFAGLSGLALYELAFKTIFLSRSAVVVGTTALVPMMTVRLNTDTSEAIVQYRRIRAVTTAGAIVAMVSALLVSPIVSFLWMNDVAVVYIAYSAILAVGSALNAWGAAAYNVGIALGTLRYNILGATATLTTMVVAGLPLGQFAGPFAAVSAVSAAWGAGGLLVQHLNEALLRTRATT
jgi:O-antigen/teichoic acid export membrane protein